MKLGLVICLLSLLGSPVSAKVLAGSWSLTKGHLAYHVNFPLKSVEGESTQVKGKGVCQSEKCSFLLAAPIRSFDSGDGNRDTRMLKVTRAAKHPMVSVRVDLPSDFNEQTSVADVEVEFSGHKKVYKSIPVATEFDEKGAKTRGTLPLLLSDFEIERPSLLGVSIDNEVPVDFELEWKNN